MFQSLDVFRTAMAMARHAGQQQALSAQNIANADTPGYQARRLTGFAESLRAGPAGLRATRPGHLAGQGPAPPAREDRGAAAALDPNGNSVSVEAEMVQAVAAKRQHDRALAIYRSNLSILRTALGRG
jgi:flagellar basal-body rod protein FlgB